MLHAGICRLFFKYNYRIRYTKQEHVKKISQIKHPSVRECLNFLKIEKGIEMQHNADLPSMSGLGSSSSFTVGFLNALYALQGQMVDKRQLALDAIHVEQKLIRENVGAQDQTIAAYGGFNKIEFGGRNIINVVPLVIDPKRLDSLENHLMLFFTGLILNASNVAKTQIRATNKKDKELRQMLKIVESAQKVLIDKREPIKIFGELLDETWKIKRRLTTKISNGEIDEIYEAAREAGATGGKLLGAGGGGFMLFFVEPNKQADVKSRLKKLLHVPFKFEEFGSQIIYKMPNDF